MVHWLRLCAPDARDQSLFGGLDPHATAQSLHAVTEKNIPHATVQLRPRAAK